MAHHQQKLKKQRATAGTDLCRLVICAVGCGLMTFAICGYFDGERGWPLAATGVLGLVLIAVGIFGKPKTVEGI